MTINITLKKLGLNDKEIKVYLALLEEGPSTAGKILKKAEIHNSVFHFNINRLIEKGLVSYLKKGKFKVYQAAEPDNFLTYLHDKEKEVQNILPELKARQNFASEKMEAEIYRGLKGIMTALNALIEKAKKNEEFLFFSTQREENNEEIQKFYQRYDTKRKEKGLTLEFETEYERVTTQPVPWFTFQEDHLMSLESTDEDNSIIINVADANFREIYKLKEKLKETIISGIKGIKQILIVKKERDYVILTLGTNLKKMLELKEVHGDKIISNDLHEVAEVFGVEAARQLIINEIKEVLIKIGFVGFN